MGTCPVRVAQVVGKMRAGGVEAFLMNYYRHVDRNRVQFDFIIDEDSPNRELVPEIESLGGRVFEVPRYQDLSRYLPAMEALFRREAWPIVHSQINALSVFPLMAAKRAGVPVRIAHSHSAAGKGENVARRLAKDALRPLANAFPTHRMACSRHAGEWLFGGASFEVVYDAIELDRFAYSREVREEVRHELDLPAEAIVVGHVGRFMEQKNHAFLLETFSRLAAADDGCFLMLAGEGPLMGDVRRQAFALGVSDKVLFLGQRDDPERLYQAMDVLALPSIYEGLGMVAIEAQTAGLPCVLSEAVPKEVAFTDAVSFLSLKAGARAWAYRCTDLVGTAERITGEIPGTLKAYDIERAALELTDYYCSLS